MRNGSPIDFATNNQSGAMLTARERENPNDWFESCTRKLHKIAALEFDWDSYGAKKPRSLSLHYAHAFLAFIHRSVNVAEPVITPGPNGNICFEWDDEIRHLTTELDDSGVHHYYYCKGDVEKEGESIDSTMIRSLLIKL